MLREYSLLFVCVLFVYVYVCDPCRCYLGIISLFFPKHFGAILIYQRRPAALQIYEE